MLPAIILAAGASRRMGRPKALLPAEGGRPFVAQIVRTLAAAGLEEIVVVTGPDHDAIADAVAQDRPPVSPRFARNPEPERGQLSSLWVGMDAALRPSSEGMLVTLVDVPGITPAVVSAVVEAWRRTRAPIVRPAIGERHGHPVVFDRAVFGELRAAPLDAGAKAVVRAHARDILDVPVSDEGCLIDVDTPADYRQLLSG
ncbi:MAG TPA: nucleotidyltransferase family protein [Vicinamibacterales bacterium]|nr:nucleotidyltransferase family protein [Vicinamibacterales bacterium]